MYLSSHHDDMGTESLPSVTLALSLLLLMSLILLLQDQEIAFSQLGDDTSLLVNPNMTTSGMPTSNESVVASDSRGFVANGKINTVIDVPNGKWLASGNWSIIVNNGNVTSFETKMTWYNSTGTNAYTQVRENNPYLKITKMENNLQQRDMI